MDPADVSAVIPTRGNVPLGEILASLSDFAEVIVWDNRVEHDYAVYGRYMALGRASKPVVYTQDDDCIVEDAAALCAAYEPGTLTVNMPESRWRDYPDSALVGWGAIFDSELPDRAFSEFGEHTFNDTDEQWLRDLDHPWFNRVCDVIFSTLAPRRRKLDIGFRHLPWAESPGRMFTNDPAAHAGERAQALRLAREVRDSR